MRKVAGRALQPQNNRPLLAVVLLVGVVAGYVLGYVFMETASTVRASARAEPAMVATGLAEL